MPTRYPSIMLRLDPLESPIAPATPSITATEFAAWLLSPQAIGPCPWFVRQAEPSTLTCRRAREPDDAAADILAALSELSQ